MIYKVSTIIIKEIECAQIYQLLCQKVVHMAITVLAVPVVMALHLFYLPIICISFLGYIKVVSLLSFYLPTQSDPHSLINYSSAGHFITITWAFQILQKLLRLAITYHNLYSHT